MMPPSWKPHVVIIGAGLGGLVLAQSLRKNGISFEIHDRDISLNSRIQGWAIAIHTILSDLISSIPDDVPSIYNTSHFRPLDLRPQICFFAQVMKFSVEANEENTDIVRANRMKLRETLAHGLNVQWNKKAAKIEEGPAGIKVTFSDGSSALGDILVGADGINSIVRETLTGGHPPLEIVPVGTIIAEPTLNKDQFEFMQRLARSSYVASGFGYHFFVGLSKVAEDSQSAKYYWFFIWEDQTVKEGTHWTSTASQEDRFKFVVEQSASLAPELIEILKWTKLEDIRPTLVVRDQTIDTLPTGRITILGDACHSMTPFKGEGGVHAMRDALGLGRAIARIGSPEDIESHLHEFNEEMLIRGAHAVRESRGATDQRHGQRGGQIYGWGQPVKVATD